MILTSTLARVIRTPSRFTATIQIRPRPASEAILFRGLALGEFALDLFLFLTHGVTEVLYLY